MDERRERKGGHRHISERRHRKDVVQMRQRKDASVLQ